MNQIQKAKQQAGRDTMKITTTTIWAGPQGVAKVGTVLDLPTEQAEQAVKLRYARPYDKERDKKAPSGLTKAPGTFE